MNDEQWFEVLVDDISWGRFNTLNASLVNVKWTKEMLDESGLEPPHLILVKDNNGKTVYDEYVCK